MVMVKPGVEYRTIVSYFLYTAHNKNMGLRFGAALISDAEAILPSYNGRTRLTTRVCLLLAQNT